MKNIKLLRLSVSNFKGLKQFTFEPNGESCSIYGANGLGKSSLADALNWLLFDKNQAGQKDFGIKPMGDDGKEINNLEHIVECDIRNSFDDGVIGHQSLKKVMTEKWTKKRGSASPEFSGHETAYFANSVPTSKSEYDALVNNIAFGDVFRMLTSTTYFNTMKWQDRRLVLLSVAGDVSDADVIDANPSLVRLNEIPEGRSIADHLKVLKAQRPKVNTAIDAIAPRIAEAGRDKPSDISMMPPEGNYAALKTRLTSLQNERAGLLAGDTTALKQQVLAIRQEIQKMDEEYLDKKRLAEDEKCGFDKAKYELENSLKRSKSTLETDKELCLNLARRITELRKKWAEVDSMISPSSTCSLCGQDLPDEMAEDILKKFCCGKAEAMKTITESALGLTGEKKTFEEKITTTEHDISTLNANYEMAKESAENVEFPVAPDHSLKKAAIDKLTSHISTVATADTDEIDCHITEVNNLIISHDAAALNRQRAADIEKRVSELKAEQKKLAGDLENIDREIMLCENFTKAKVSMLTNAVNAKFAPLSFKLFDMQINGGIAECCEVMARNESGALIPYSDLSRGQKAVAGLSVIKVLSEHYGITAPVFIDDAEGITLELPLVDGGQYIRLVADKAYDELTVKEVTA